MDIVGKLYGSKAGVIFESCESLRIGVYVPIRGGTKALKTF